MSQKPSDSNTPLPAISAGAEGLCPECGEPVGCGISAGNDHCWCFNYPPSSKMPEDWQQQQCLCQKCLEKRKIAEGIWQPK